MGLALLAGFALGVQASIPVPNRGEQTLARVEQFILNEFGQSLSLRDLAAAAGSSRQHLLKLFRRHRGVSPTQYLYERRLCVAAGQLSHTGLSIKEIAQQCGFANAFHFSRKFKTAYGTSPRLWRSQKWSSAG